MTEHVLCSWCSMVTLLSDMMFVLHSSYRLFCCRLHHVGSACGWTRPDYCDYCSSHQSSRWENSHQHQFGLMNTKCQFTAEMLLCALFPREPESAWWRHCEHFYYCCCCYNLCWSVFIYSVLFHLFRIRHSCSFVKNKHVVILMPV